MICLLFFYLQVFEGERGGNEGEKGYQHRGWPLADATQDRGQRTSKEVPHHQPPRMFVTAQRGGGLFAV